jgi:predicted nucleotidyltransferase
MVKCEKIKNVSMIQLQPLTDAEIEKRMGLSSSAIKAVCVQWEIMEMAVFGSIVRSDFRADSDIDLLLHFSPQAQQGLLTLARIKHELESSTKKRVEIAIKELIVNSENPIRRDEILKIARIIYAQR